ncbi:hypothetical protein A1O1_06498 [Capronia coronata CBS 617.96]|uniref:Uncharacterized protein n=1 Tax=Capronia coronata CBS 617.96 TaxID=1182541 RepID=W9Y0V6_9EURO|nr:uncharacterized protein A1O1_06498 [Capronia coronata CBS 617.96]EXJ86128.1 hypothetical protein A1O1_06498 [Capronia coronata CBS 617.96]
MQSIRAFSLSSLSLAILLLHQPLQTHAAPEPQAVASTLTAISQIPDGQIQAAASSPSVAVSDPSATSSYDNPFTSYTSMTNSLGVITGMPSVVTSQPEVVTSQPVSPTLPTYSGYVYANSSSSDGTAVASSALLTADSSGTTLATSTVAASGSGSQGQSTDTKSATATFAQATGGAVSNKVAGAGVSLVVLGLCFSLL